MREAIARLMRSYSNYVWTETFPFIPVWTIFSISTNHKPLQRIFGTKHAIPVQAAHCLQRWALIWAAFDYDIQFGVSKLNAVAELYHACH